MAFPVTRMRRLRRSAGVRDLVRETRVSPADLIQPYFVRHGSGEEEIPSMPGQHHLSVDSLGERAAAAHAAGVPAVMLFGLPARKDEAASEAFDDEGIVQMAVRALKARVPELVVMTDVCLCQYTSHGHCGIIQDGDVAK
jgi:porphobilinogen synthase